MLKGIPAILPPELLKVLYEMRHGDRILIADGEQPVELMQPADSGIEVPIWKEFFHVIEKNDMRGEKVVRWIERFAFYEEAKTCYAIVTSSEKAIYANVMLQKGVI